VCGSVRVDWVNSRKTMLEAIPRGQGMWKLAALFSGATTKKIRFLEFFATRFDCLHFCEQIDSEMITRFSIVAIHIIRK
jgi:hypothetical protein